MKTVPVKVTVDSKAAQAALAKLPSSLRATIQKRVMRRELAVLRDKLKSAWRNTRTHRRGTHLRAIAAATQSDARRIKDGIIRGQVGVSYKARKGKQRIWHLLEHGFRHGGRGSHTYRNRADKLVRRDERLFIRAGIERAQAEVKGRDKAAKEKRRVIIDAVRAEAKQQFGPRKIAAPAAKLPANASGRVVGRRISTHIVRAMLPKVARAIVRATTMEAVWELMKGKGRR